MASVPLQGQVRMLPRPFGDELDSPSSCQWHRMPTTQGRQAGFQVNGLET